MRFLFNTGKRLQRHMGRVRRNARLGLCRCCSEPPKTWKTLGNSKHRWLARDLRQLVTSE